MNNVDDLIRGLKLVASLLDAPDMEPDAARTDWGAYAPRLRIVRENFDREVMAHAPHVFSALNFDPAQENRAREQVAVIALEASVLFHCARELATAGELLSTAASVAPASGPARDEIEAARRDPASHAALVRGRWLLTHGRFDHADHALKELRKQCSDRAIRDWADALLNGPRPMKGSAPALFRLNGFGFGLYGTRDRRPDGSYVSTYCVSALFIPVFPLSAYRVRQEGNRYYFLAREPLSRFARVARAAILVAGLGGAGGAALNARLTSPDHLASRGVADARRAEQSHRTEAALEGYQTVIREYAGKAGNSTLAEAAEGIVRISTTSVAEPLTPARVDEVGRVVSRFDSLPESARAGAPSEALYTRMERWETQLGDASEEAAEAQLRVAEMSLPFAGPAHTAHVRERVAALHRRIAETLVRDWPREALNHYALAQDPESTRAATPVVRSIIASPSLALAAETDLVAWAHQARIIGDSELASLADSIDTALTAAHRVEHDDARSAALSNNDPAALEAARARQPNDQEVVVALADLRRANNDSAGALTMLRAVGPAGHWIDRGQLLMASCLRDSGQDSDADALLTHFVAARLPAFQSAQHRYRAATTTALAQIRAQLESDSPPADLSAQVEAASESERNEIIRAWVSRALSNDASLQELKRAFEQNADVVPASLQLATMRLQAASRATGDARTSLLNDAERLFLAVREESDDVPALHLGLGQVYHRLGKTAEAEREFAMVQQRNDADSVLALAETLRELGLDERARQVAQAVYDKNEQPGSSQAAFFLAVNAILPTDRETWLRRAPQDNLQVRIELRELEGARLRREGHFREADEAYAGAVAEYGHESSQSPAARGNAALIELQRYTCTGDPSRLDAAVDGLESALRMLPGNSVLMANLVTAREYQSNAKALSRYAHTRELHATAQEIESVLDGRLAGPARTAIETALRTDPGMRRMLEVAHARETLAPESSESYDEEFDVHSRTSDLVALRDLETRINAVAHLDSGREDAMRGRFERGEVDDSVRREADAAIVSADAALANARASHHAPTVASAQIIRAHELLRRAMTFGVPADADAAVAALREADQLDPASGAAHALPWALLGAGMLGARAASPAIEAQFHGEGRSVGTEVQVQRAVAGTGGDAARAALLARPEVTEALALLRQTEAEHPGLAAWMVARALGDAELERVCAPAKTREDIQISARIEARLHPNSANARARLAALQSP